MKESQAIRELFFKVSLAETLQGMDHGVSFSTKYQVDPCFVMTENSMIRDSEKALTDAINVIKRRGELIKSNLSS